MSIVSSGDYLQTRLSHRQTKAGAREQSRRETLTCEGRRTGDSMKADRQIER